MLYTSGMASKELLDAITTLQSKGVDDARIRTELVKQGWSDEDITGAYAAQRIAQMPNTIQGHTDFVPTRPQYRKSSWIAEVCSGIVILLLLGATVLYVYRIPIPYLNTDALFALLQVPTASNAPITQTPLSWFSYTASSTPTLPVITLSYPSVLGTVTSAPHAHAVIGLTFTANPSFKTYVSMAQLASTQSFQDWVTEKYGYSAMSPHSTFLPADTSTAGYQLINGRLSLVVDSYLSKGSDSLYLIELKNRKVLIVSMLGSSILPPERATEEKAVRDTIAESIAFGDTSY
jgi:hypothetical protein